MYLDILLMHIYIYIYSILNHIKVQIAIAIKSDIAIQTGHEYISWCLSSRRLCDNSSMYVSKNNVYPVGLQLIVMVPGRC